MFDSIEKHWCRKFAKNCLDLVALVFNQSLLGKGKTTGFPKSEKQKALFRRDRAGYLYI